MILRIFVLLSLLYSIAAKAQISGYMGHRLVVSAGGGLGMPIGLFGENGYSLANEMARQGTLNITYVTGRHSSLGLGVALAAISDTAQITRYARTGEVPTFIVGYPNANAVVQIPVAVSSRLLATTLSLRLNTKGKKGSIAPCGRYFEFGGGAALYHYGKPSEDLKPYLANAVGAIVKIATGAQVVYKDRIAIDYGIETSLPIVLPSDDVYEFAAGQSGTLYSQTYNTAHSIRQFWTARSIMPYLRIGLLP